MAAIADEDGELVYDVQMVVPEFDPYVPNEDPDDVPKPSIKPFLMTEEEKAKKQAEDVATYKAYTESLIQRRSYYERLITACSRMGASKKLQFTLNSGRLGSDTKLADNFAIIPVVFRDSVSRATIFENFGISVEVGHITTMQQIERILLHVVMSTEFKELQTRHNRYLFHFDKMDTRLLSLLITEILNSNSKRINYSWVAPLQELVINYDLRKPKKKLRNSKHSFGLPTKKSPSLPSWTQDSSPQIRSISYSSGGLLGLGDPTTDDQLKKKIEAQREYLEEKRRGSRPITPRTIQNRVARLSKKILAEFPVGHLERLAMAAPTYEHFLNDVREEYRNKQHKVITSTKDGIGIAENVPTAGTPLQQVSISGNTFYYSHPQYGSGTVQVSNPLITGTSGAEISPAALEQSLEAMKKEHFEALLKRKNEPKVERIIPKTPPTMNASNETQW